MGFQMSHDVNISAIPQFPMLPEAAALLVLGQQYDQAEDEPQDQQVGRHQEERHWI